MRKLMMKICRKQASKARRNRDIARMQKWNKRFDYWYHA